MRNYNLYLSDILESARMIQKYTKGITLAKLKRNRILIDAVVRNLEIIGEAAKNLPSNIKTRYPDIEWKKISGMRDILAHEYFGVDRDVIWDVIKNKIPDLNKKIKLIIKSQRKNLKKKK